MYQLLLNLLWILSDFERMDSKVQYSTNKMATLPLHNNNSVFIYIYADNLFLIINWFFYMRVFHNLTKLTTNWLQTGETVTDVKINDALTDRQKQEVNELLLEFTSTLTDKPGLTDLTELSLKLTDDRLIRLKLYPLPHAKVDDVRRELKTILDLDVIEKTDSVYSSPIVLIKKCDNAFHFCVY